MIEGFNAALDERGIKADPTQQAAALRLQKFYDDLIAFKAARRSKLRKLLIHPDLPRGVYFWGGVGRGKSFLMDCFFAAVPYDRKRRVHFHAFMREIHAMLKSFRNESDPLARVAEQIADRTRLMCFDEFHISDIADALILGRLLRALPTAASPRARTGCAAPGSRGGLFDFATLCAGFRSQHDYLASGHRRFETHAAGSRPETSMP